MPLKQLQVGDRDVVGYKILGIYSSSENYVVYRTSLGLRYVFVKGLEEKLNEIRPIFTKLSALQTGSLKKNDSINFGLARAIDQCMSGRFDDSKEALLQIEKRLQNIRTIRGRLFYLLSCALSGSFFLCALGLVLMTSSSYPDGLFSTNKILFQVAACGALGGFFSVSLGIRKVEIDMDDDWYVSAISGATRILVAVIGSLFIYFAIISGIFFPKLAELGNAAIYAFSIAAGFSETLVPNILRRVAKEKEAEPDES